MLNQVIVQSILQLHKPLSLDETPDLDSPFFGVLCCQELSLDDELGQPRLGGYRLDGERFDVGVGRRQDALDFCHRLGSGKGFSVRHLGSPL